MKTEDLLAWGKELEIHAMQALTSNGELLTAGSWCKFCPAATICPAIKNEVSKTARIAFDTVNDDLPIDPKELNPVALANILDKADMIRAWLSSCESQALEYSIVEPGAVPGYYAAEKYGNRKWLSEAVAAEALKGYGKVIYSKPELLSVAQMEKALKGVNITPLIEKPFTGYALKKGVPQIGATKAAVAFDDV